MMWWGDGWSGVAWGGFALMHLLFWGLVIVGIVSLIRWGLGSGNRSDRYDGHDRAMDVLRERYARGEIDKDEFEERKRILKG